MQNPWEAEFRVEKNLARRLIETQFPELNPVSLEFIGEGWDNVVYRVNHHYIFRFPRRELGAALVETEWKALPYLAEHLPIAIPEPLFFGNPTREYHWHFLGYSYIPGTSANKLHLTIDERTRLAKPLAYFLKALHTIKVDPNMHLNTDIHVTNKLDIAKRFPTALENIQKIKALGIFEDCDKLLEILESVKNVRNSEQAVFVHGDLTAVHMLLDKSKQLSGVIDWGDVHLGNKATDLNILFSFFPPEGSKAFLEAYGPIDGQTKQLALFRTLNHTAWTVLYAHNIKNKDTLEEALTGLQLIIQNAS